MKAATLRVRGVVQGVGFRPTVWQLATAAGLDGDVVNDPEGVLIRLQGQAAQLDTFAERLRAAAPPLSRIDSIDCTAAPICSSLQGFHIGRSRQGTVDTGICADAAPCPACLAEMQDPANRRYRYPFINCTHCGPRFSIVEAIPWDRPHTSMAGFTMCTHCQAEYDDPANRRFHAQPNACPACGPVAWFENIDGATVDTDAVAACAERLLAGDIIAIKGIGGFHLACDALNDAAVARLRRRKQRPHKPLAMMAADLKTIRRYTACSQLDADALSNPAAPIVLLPPRSARCGDSHTAPLSKAISPGIELLGFMLPSSPLHALLMAAIDRPLVMTSGNRAGRPPCIDNDAARRELADIAGGFLMHDRAIANRIDDSVMRIIDGEPRLLRRARGFAPMPVTLPAGLQASRPLIAYGAELKHTFCIARHDQAMLSQHIGDLENAATLADLEHNLALYASLYQHTGADIALDPHPEYLSAKLARSTHAASDDAQSLCEVNHHHAHFAACLADNGVEPSHPACLGIVLDGLGLGADGTLWGGEFLLGTLAGSRRVAHLRAVALPGGAQAVRQPWRNLVARLHGTRHLDGFRQAHPAHPLSLALAEQPVAAIEAMLNKALNSPPCSSAGRLFDAVAAALGLAFDTQSYEGQAAMQLESLAGMHTLENSGASGNTDTPYPFAVIPTGGTAEGASTELAEGTDDTICLDDAPLWPMLLDDLARGVTPAAIAARFHTGFADAVASLARDLATRHATECIALSGGVMQNRLLVERLAARLKRDGLCVLQHRQVPANDAGIAFGQTVATLARQCHESTPAYAPGPDAALCADPLPAGER